MNKKAKVGIAALAVIATGSLGLALPALAHDRGEREGYSSESRQAHGTEAHNRATLDAAISGIPEDVTEAKAATRAPTSLFTSLTATQHRFRSKNQRRMAGESAFDLSH